MAEYTYKDVIIDPDDPRVEIGEKYFFFDYPLIALRALNGEDIPIFYGPLEDIEERGLQPFKTAGNTNYTCLIRKKETEKKYVPFDLSLEEDRAKLREAWIRPKGRPSVGLKIIAMNIDCVFFYGEKGQSTEDLFMEYEFIDGTPCGKPVEKA